MGKDSYALATGLFVTIMLTVVMIIVIWLGDVQQQTQTYIAETRESVTGLNVGSTVYYRGIAVGKVDAVSFDPTNVAVIIVSLKIDNKVSFPRGIYATLDLKGVTGLTKIAIKDRGGSLKPFRPGNRIPIRPSIIDRLTVSGEETIKQTHDLIFKLNQLLDEDNIQHIEQILINVESATGRFNSLQAKAEVALDQVPLLTTDARQTLAEVSRLSRNFKQLSKQMQQELMLLSTQSNELIQTGSILGQQVLHTSLPKAHRLMTQMQTTLRRFDRVATLLETNPQAFFLGTELQSPAPGE